MSDVGQTNGARIEKLRKQLLESDSLLHLLRSQIRQLQLSNDDEALAREEEVLRRENAQLRVRVEALRSQLAALEAANGLDQIPLPADDAQAPEEPPMTAKATRKEEAAAPKEDANSGAREDEKKKKQEKKKNEKAQKKQQQKQNEPKEQKKPPAGDTEKGPRRAPDRAALMTFLAEVGITDLEVREHPEVFTVETMMPYLEGLSGAVGKNLFLKDKKKRLYLLSAKHDAEVRLNDVAKQVGASGGLRLADESILLDALGVRQGAVNPFALANDVAGVVTFLVDKTLVDGSYDRVNFHPMSNAATLGMSVESFKKFLAATKHDPVTIKL